MTTSDISVRVEGLSKCYQVYDCPRDRLFQFIFRGRKKFYRDFWALHPVTFQVQRGECVGFIGRNGSGKSTLLQILAGILTPTTGTFKVNGRVAALLELGAGFNPDFTGRENVFINAAVLGLTRSEIESRYDRIVAFSEIGDFIDQPVKTYSSGMYVRLAFSIAIHVDPEILIVDEALSVGDAAFQYKCMNKIEELQKKGMSIILVSHDTGTIKRFCSKAGWIHQGSLVVYGDAVEVAHRYEDFVREEIASKFEELHKQSSVKPKSPVDSAVLSASIKEVKLLNAHGVESTVVVTGSDMKVRISYELQSPPPDGVVVGAAIYRGDNLYVCGLNTGLDKFEPLINKGEHYLEIVYPSISLLAGSYYFKVGIFDKRGMVILDFNDKTAPFTVTTPYVAEGLVLLNHYWATR